MSLLVVVDASCINILRCQICVVPPSFVLIFVSYLKNIAPYDKNTLRHISQSAKVPTGLKPDRQEEKQARKAS